MQTPRRILGRDVLYRFLFFWLTAFDILLMQNLYIGLGAEGNTAG